MIIRCIYCEKKIEKGGEEIKKIMDMTNGDISPTDFLEMMNVAEGKTCQREEKDGGVRERHVFVWDIEFAVNIEILKNKINNIYTKKEKWNMELADTKNEIELLAKEILNKKEKIRDYEAQLIKVEPEINEYKDRFKYMAGLDLKVWK